MIVERIISGLDNLRLEMPILNTKNIIFLIFNGKQRTMPTH